MKIGILQCGHLAEPVARKHGDYFTLYRKMLDGQGFEFADYSVVDMQFPASVTECDGWLLGGSRHGAYDDLPFIPVLEQFIRDAYAAGVPMVGICFGHQIIAQALGGKVEKFSGGWTVGRQEYALEGKAHVALNAWHQDQVTVAPPGATRIGRSDTCENAAFLYDGRAFTVQPHPEFSAEAVADLIALMEPTGRIPADRIAEADRRRGLPTDEIALARRIGDFFKHARETADV